MGNNSKVKTSPTGATIQQGFLSCCPEVCRSGFDFPTFFCLVAFVILAWCLTFFSRIMWEYLYRRKSNSLLSPTTLSGFYRNPGYKRTSTLCGSTKHVVCISDLQNTSSFHPDRPGRVEPAFTFTVDVWEFLTFHRVFSGLCSAPGSWKCLYRWSGISRLLENSSRMIY